MLNEAEMMGHQQGTRLSTLIRSDICGGNAPAGGQTSQPPLETKTVCRDDIPYGRDRVLTGRHDRNYISTSNSAAILTVEDYKNMTSGSTEYDRLVATSNNIDELFPEIKRFFKKAATLRDPEDLELLSKARTAFKEWTTRLPAPR
ncbi:hypothetical protein VTN77DRAFT_9887 [Rasamsonia byssochlamydoides]|uniref:uncharacterized protein n=1 Tax=Rasamsonia byssochlamydoides TaxID=89139 RepID=UPI00374269C5